MLYLKSFTFNPFQQNTYVLYNDAAQALIIDAGNSNASEDKALKDFVSDKNLKPERFLLTHAHIDHVMGNKFVHETFGLLPEVHRAEQFFLDRMVQSAQTYGLNCEQSPTPAHYLEDGETVNLGDYEFNCIFAPGHSPGSICFYNASNKLLIGGDVLFNGSIGRSDLPMGNHEQLLRSIHERLMELPDETKVYCGHGPSTTIGKERVGNPFLR